MAHLGEFQALALLYKYDIEDMVETGPSVDVPNRTIDIWHFEKQ